MGRCLTIDPVTRLEGHGRIDIFLDDRGGVEDCFFRIPELRGFERFVVGRPVEELPRIVTRICGVCPASHHLAGAKAVDGCFGGTVAPLAVKLREMYYQAHFLHSHIAHFYLLAAPDFICGPESAAAVRNVLGLVAKVGVETGRAVIRARSKAQHVQELIGGRSTHPVWCLPGGVAKGLSAAELEEIRPLAAELLDFSQFSLDLFRKAIRDDPDYHELLLHGPYSLDLPHMGLVGPRNTVSFYDGEVRVVDQAGAEICRYQPADYHRHVAEHVEPWTYLKFPYLRERGWRGFVDGPGSSIYCAGPLSRLNAADRMATPEAQAAREELFATLGGPPSQALLGQHWARLVEMVQAAETLRDHCADPEITGDDYRIVPSGISGEGVGIVEAMRGTLTHHYTCDQNGICTSANLIVGTTNNNAAIQMLTRKVAAAYIQPGVEPGEGLLNRIEMAFRSFDPCFSCATHSLPGGLPLRVRLHQGGGLKRELVRGAGGGGVSYEEDWGKTMEKYRLKRDAPGGLRALTPVKGERLLRHPMYNKGSAFSHEERERLGLVGLLPEAVNTMEQQAHRALSNILRTEEPLQRYVALAALQDRNEHLFYRVLVDNLETLLPIVYTPTVGQACQEYSHIFRRARGLWITPEHRGYISEVLGNAPFEDVRLIVVTDNERILGLGDQGAGGMGIPIGKLALYTAAAGIHPSQTLPISLDVGTDNEKLIQDELYLGWRHPRLRGPDYESLVDEFVYAAKKRFPHAILQWEDFKKGNAARLLARYRKVLPSFNDDVQGTAAVVVAGLMAAARKAGVPFEQQRTVVLGAGAAGIGVASLVRATLRRGGVAGDDLFRQLAVLDSRGLLVDDTEIPDAYKREFAWPAALAEKQGLGPGRPRDLEAVVAALEPTVLIGLSGAPGAFGEAVVRTMAAHCAQPVLMPMSNPTSKLEAQPADIARWSEGRALIATGSSPIEDVRYAERNLRVAAGNNALVFPGVALGVLVSGAREVSDQLFAAAAEALARCVSPSDLAAGGLFPELRELRRVAAKVAEAVVRTARDTGLGRQLEDPDIPGAVAEAMWEPRYVHLEYAPEEKGAREEEVAPAYA